MGTHDDAVLRVSGSTPVAKLASAISHAVYEQKPVTLRAIGAGAVGQGVKAIAIAQGFVATRGWTLYCRPGFVTVPGADKPISAITLQVVATLGAPPVSALH